MGASTSVIKIQDFREPRAPTRSSDAQRLAKKHRTNLPPLYENRDHVLCMRARRALSHGGHKENARTVVDCFPKICLAVCKCQYIPSRDPSCSYKWDQTRLQERPSWINCCTDQYWVRSFSRLSPRDRISASPCHVCHLSPRILEWSTGTQHSRSWSTWPVPLTVDCRTDGMRPPNWSL